MIALPIGFGVLAVAAWLGAAVHAVMLVGHRRDDVSLAQLVVQGHRFFSRDTWKPEGHAIHGRFVRLAFAFFVCVVAGAAGGILASQSSS